MVRWSVRLGTVWRFCGAQGMASVCVREARCHMGSGTVGSCPMVLCGSAEWCALMMSAPPCACGVKWLASRREPNPCVVSNVVPEPPAEDDCRSSRDRSVCAVCMRVSISRSELPRGRPKGDVVALRLDGHPRRRCPLLQTILPIRPVDFRRMHAASGYSRRDRGARPAAAPPCSG